MTARTRDRSCAVCTSDKLAKQPVKAQSASPDCRHRAGKGLNTNAEVPDTIAPWRGRLRTLSTRAREVLHGRGPLCPGSWDPHECPRLTVSIEPAMSFPNLLMQVIEFQPEVQSHVQNMHSESRADNQAPFPPSQIFMNDRE